MRIELTFGLLQGPHLPENHVETIDITVDSCHHCRMIQTTVETVTNEQLTALREEGQRAGDSAQVRLCDLALAGDENAKDLCVFVIQVNEQQRRAG